jgi:hypothetical protein
VPAIAANVPREKRSLRRLARARLSFGALRIAIHSAFKRLRRTLVPSVIGSIYITGGRYFALPLGTNATRIFEALILFAPAFRNLYPKIFA